MVEENKNPILPDKEREVYDKLKTSEPPREVEQPSGENQPPKMGLDEAMEMSEDLTDFQTAIRILHPRKREIRNARVARIDPGVFLAGIHLSSVDEIMRSNPQEKIDVNLIYMSNYYDYSIGLDGKGIIDVAELLGAAREEKKARDLLMGGRALL